MFARIFAIVAVVAGIGCVVLFLLWDNASAKRAIAESQRDEALEANASLVGEAKRAKADAAAEAERAIQRQRERDGLAANVAALRQRLSDASNTCVLSAGDLDAIDRFLRGEH